MSEILVVDKTKQTGYVRSNERLQRIKTTHLADQTLPPSHWADQFKAFLDTLDEISPPEKLEEENDPLRHIAIPDTEWRRSLFCINAEIPNARASPRKLIKKNWVRFTRHLREKYEHVIGDEEKWYPIPLERQKPDSNNPMDMVETFNKLMPLERICPSTGKILRQRYGYLKREGKLISYYRNYCILNYRAKDIPIWQWRFLFEWRGIENWKYGEQSPHVNHLYPDVCFHGKVSTTDDDHYHFYSYEHYVDRSVTLYYSKVIRFYHPPMPEVRVKVGKQWLSLTDAWWRRKYPDEPKRWKTEKRPQDAPFYIDKDGKIVYVASSSPCTWRYKSLLGKSEWDNFPIPSAPHWHTLRRLYKHHLLIELQKKYGRVGVWNFWWEKQYPHRYRDNDTCNFCLSHDSFTKYLSIVIQRIRCFSILLIST